jgi:hypothetical protein
VRECHQRTGCDDSRAGGVYLVLESPEAYSWSRMRHPRIMVVSLAGFAVCALSVAGCGGTKREVVPPVSIPNLIGKNTLRGQALLRERGLRWRWEEGVRPGIANGFIGDTIEGQSPVPGQWVRPGTVVLISPGSEMVVNATTSLNPYG